MTIQSGMSSDTYEGWVNRETWAVALHVNNSEWWQLAVLEALQEAQRHEQEPLGVHSAAEVVREQVEQALDEFCDLGEHGSCCTVRGDIGSLWRVAWQEVAESFLPIVEPDGFQLTCCDEEP